MLLFISLTLIIAGIGLTRRPNWARRGRLFVILGVLILFVFSNSSVSLWLARPLESSYKPVPEIGLKDSLPRQLAECQFVVILSCPSSDSADVSPNNRLSRDGLARIIEAVRILNHLPNAKLVLLREKSEIISKNAEASVRTAESLGIARARMILLRPSEITEEQIEIVSKEIGNAPFALVDTARHLPRVVSLFRRIGLSPLPCPVEFLSNSDLGLPPKLAGFYWDAQFLDRNSKAIQEYLSRCWLWISGKSV